MKQGRYMAISTMAAHWFLPSAEAGKAADDSRELLKMDPSSEDNVTDKSGSSARASRILVNPPEYRRWLAMFCAMALCLLVPAATLFCRTHYPTLAAALSVAGACLSLIWFRHDMGSRRPIPKALFICLLGLLLLAGGLLGSTIWCIINPAALSFLSSSPVLSVAAVFNTILLCLGVLAATCGLFGLILARIADARWRALFVFSLTIVASCSLVLSVMHSMDFYHVTLTPGPPMLYRCLLTALAGLGLTGISLY